MLLTIIAIYLLYRYTITLAPTSTQLATIVALILTVVVLLVGYIPAIRIGG